MRELLRYFQELDAEVRAASITALRIALILALAWALQALAARLIRLFRRYMQRKSPSLDEQARIETLARVFRNGAAVIIVLVAGMLVLGELGISIAPILATAGVAGVALGFGAQSLIKDYFNGFFLLLDDQIRESDVVEVAGKSGLVEEVTLRYVRLRDFDGHVHFVPNGEIKVVSNRTRSFAYAAVDVGVGYGVDIDQALALMREAGQAMRADAKWQARLADDIEILGVERLDNSAVVLRCRLKVVPAIEQWNVKREFLKRVKLAFDARGIEMPFPQLTVHVAKDAGRP
ncbi:MAG TPA: mechanosensitive ion channel family protein [Burkholderiales bacterium]